MDGEGRSDLEEPDQLEPVQPLGTGLVGVDLRQPGVHGRASTHWDQRVTASVRVVLVLVVTERARGELPSSTTPAPGRDRRWYA